MRSPRDVGVHRDSVSNSCHAQRDQNITQTRMHSEKAPSFGQDLCTGCVLQCTSTVLRESTMQVYDNREQQSNTVLFFGRHCGSKGRGRKCKGTFHQFQEILCECASRWREKNRYVVVCDDIDSASPDVKTVDILCHT